MINRLVKNQSNKTNWKQQVKKFHEYTIIYQSKSKPFVEAIDYHEEDLQELLQLYLVN